MTGVDYFNFLQSTPVTPFQKAEKSRQFINTPRDDLQRNVPRTPIEWAKFNIQPGRETPTCSVYTKLEQQKNQA